MSADQLGAVLVALAGSVGVVLAAVLPPLLSFKRSNSEQHAGVAGRLDQLVERVREYTAANDHAHATMFSHITDLHREQADAMRAAADDRKHGIAAVESAIERQMDGKVTDD